jgi:hypothetical protein
MPGQVGDVVDERAAGCCRCRRSGGDPRHLEVHQAHVVAGEHELVRPDIAEAEAPLVARKRLVVAQPPDGEGDQRIGRGRRVLVQRDLHVEVVDERGIGGRGPRHRRRQLQVVEVEAVHRGQLVEIAAEQPRLSLLVRDVGQQPLVGHRLLQQPAELVVVAEVAGDDDAGTVLQGAEHGRLSLQSLGVGVQRGRGRSAVAP